jgi:hypothetical protein
MNTTAISRRILLRASACTLAAAAGVPHIETARAATGQSSRSEETVRKYYAAWETKQWRPFDILLTDDFTFTSPNGDDHISKSAFKTRCWDTQIAFIERFDLRHLIAARNEGFVMYVCHTSNDKTFQNIEYLEIRGDKVAAIECYFGARDSFASAVGSKQE